MASAADLEKLILGSTPVKCDNCGEKVYYRGCGEFECKNCGQLQYDYFGKVKKYLEDHGPTPSGIISQETGVPQDVICRFLKKGRVEIPDGSSIYIKCEKCSCNIKYGRFCPQCAVELATGVKKVLAEDIGEKPKKQGYEMSGKMQYITKDKKNID